MHWNTDSKWWVAWHFNPRLYNPNLQPRGLSNPIPFSSWKEFMIENFGVKKSGVEKSGVENSGVEIGGWKVWGWNVLQP